MADIVDTKIRSRMMAAVRATNTKPELALRRRLHRSGLRFRLHYDRLPGKPDIALPKYKAALFVHGCFWHRHEGCPRTATPSTRPDFWKNKFEANRARDARNRTAILAAGWRHCVVWECTLLGGEKIERTAAIVQAWLESDSPELVVVH